VMIFRIYSSRVRVLIQYVGIHVYSQASPYLPYYSQAKDCTRNSQLSGKGRNSVHPKLPAGCGLICTENVLLYERFTVTDRSRTEAPAKRSSEILRHVIIYGVNALLFYR